MKIMASGPITSWREEGEKVEALTDFLFLGSKITADGDCSHEIKRHLLLRRKAITNSDSILRSRDFSLPTKVHRVKTMVFPVVMYGCESWTIKESRTLKNWCFRTVVLKKTLESPLDCKIQPVHPKENQPWIVIGRTDAEAEVPILWAPDAKSWLIGKERLKAREEGDSRGWDGCMVSPTQWTWVWANSGRNWGQGSLVCCSPCGLKESDMTEWLNNNKSNRICNSKEILLL